MGTEHMLICLVNRILKLLDNNTDPTAVIAAMVDWTSAFDRQDPTLGIQKFIRMGVRPSLIPVLISYLTDRKMRVKFNDVLSDVYQLIGGGPQGTLLGGIEYLVQSNNNADCVDEEERFKYVDDLSILEVLCLTGFLVEYDTWQHVPSDIGTEQMFLPPEASNTQNNLNEIARWTDENMMFINITKTKYMIFTRSRTEFATRLTVNGQTLDQVTEQKVCGVWITDDLKWEKNSRELSKGAFARISMLTKLKYVGVCQSDLIDVYKLFIRSLLEYCSVVWHSRLTVEDMKVLERVQKTSLRITLGEKYESYPSALEACDLKIFYDRREERSLKFANKCLKHPVNKRLFPLNTNCHDLHEKCKDKYIVNFAKTETLKKSTIPYLQRRLTQ